MPLLDDIKSVLSFSAFRPDPEDASIPWTRRFNGRKSLLINVNRAHSTWRGINKKGRLQESGTHEGDFVEVAQARAEEWKQLTDGGYVGVSINNRFIISLESNLSRRDNHAELLRVNAKAVLGAKFDRGKRYALYHHPESTSSILLACDDTMVKSTEDVLRNNNFKAGRVCCGLFALLEYKLQEIYSRGGAEAKGSFLLIVCCEGSIAALLQQDGQWTDLRCRSGIGTDSPEVMLQIVAPIVQKAVPGTSVMFLHDGNDTQFANAMMEQLRQISAEDVSAEDQLWRVMQQN